MTVRIRDARREPTDPKSTLLLWCADAGGRQNPRMFPGAGLNTRRRRGEGPRTASGEEQLASLLPGELNHVRPVPGTWASLRELLPGRGPLPFSGTAFGSAVYPEVSSRGAATAARRPRCCLRRGRVRPPRRRDHHFAARPDLPVYAS